MLAENLRTKLVRLGVIRCLMVTLLLGSAFAVNINNLESFDHATYHGLTVIIISAYIFSVGAALVLRVWPTSTLVAEASFAFDATAAAGLVLLTGQLMGQQYIGFVVDQILDIVAAPANMDDAGSIRDGWGRVLVEQEITDIVDLDQIALRARLIETDGNARMVAP